MNIPFDMRHALEISERPWTVLSCEPADYADSGYDPDLTLSVQDDLGRGEVFTISPFHAFYDTFWELMAGDRIRFIFGANGYDRNNDWWDSAVMHLRPIVLDRY